MDIFTSYGTQIFLPFSDYRVELNTIFIIDPAYTLPMLVALILVMFYKRESTKRKKVVFAGIMVTHIYLLFTIINKYALVEPMIKAEMEKQNLQVERYETIPAPLQNFLWQAIIKTPQGYYAGYFRPWKVNIPFDTFLFFERDLESEKELEGFKQYQGLKKFSRNYGWVEKTDNNIYIYNDMRFATAKGWLDREADFIFSFELTVDEGDMSVQRNDPSTLFEWKDLSRIFNRLITD